MTNQQRIRNLGTAIATIAGESTRYDTMEVVELAARIQDLALEDSGFGEPVSPVRPEEETTAAVAASA